MSKKLPQYCAALSAAGCAFIAGTGIGWSSPYQADITGGLEGFDCSEEQFSWIGSLMTLGAAISPIAFGFVINIIGRKWTMVVLCIPLVLSGLLILFAANVIMMYLSRFILGIVIGAFCVAAPVYIGEISEKDIRGTCGAFFQLMITIGILFQFCIGTVVNMSASAIIFIVVSILNSVILFFMPESPTYLIAKDKVEAAGNAMQFLRGKDYDYNSELNEVKANHAKSQSEKISIAKAFARPATVKALIIGVGLMFCQQFCGINAVMFYSESIFADAESGIEPATATIIIGAVQVVATLIAALIVDKTGRRFLLIMSSSLIAVSVLLMGVYFYLKGRDKDVNSITWIPLFSLILFIIMFSFGLGPVPWLMVGEIFASDVRGNAASIIGTTSWLLAFVVSKTFPNLKEWIGVGETFWLFCAITILGLIFIIFMIPETKGKSLQEVQDMLESKKD